MQYERNSIEQKQEISNEYSDEKNSSYTLDDKSSGTPQESETLPADKAITSLSSTDLAHSLTRKLTTQIVSRKAPLITCSSMDRRVVTKLSKIPWSEQKKLKEKFDASLSAKRTKRASLNSDSFGTNGTHIPGIRQSGVTSRLELKQVGRSVKYMKAGEREAQAKEKGGKKTAVLTKGKIQGEWEIEHSFLCSVCGIEYDDVLEILHHKWESHPHCLVTHVSLREGIVRPPALLYPQVWKKIFSSGILASFCRLVLVQYTLIRRLN